MQKRNCPFVTVPNLSPQALFCTKYTPVYFTFYITLFPILRPHPAGGETELQPLLRFSPSFPRFCHSPAVLRSIRGLRTWPSVHRWHLLQRGPLSPRALGSFRAILGMRESLPTYILQSHLSLGLTFSLAVQLRSRARVLCILRTPNFPSLSSSTQPGGIPF